MGPIKIDPKFELGFAITISSGRTVSDANRRDNPLIKPVSLVTEMNCIIYGRHIPILQLNDVKVFGSLSGVSEHTLHGNKLCLFPNH